MKAEDFLEQVETIDTMVQNCLIERQQWDDLAKSITAQMGGERVQSSGNPSKMADAIIACLAMEDEILAKVKRLADKKRDVVSTIEQLKRIEYDVLHMKYIQYKDFYEIADKYAKDYNWATTVHGRAKNSLQRILDEREHNARNEQKQEGNT